MLTYLGTTTIILALYSFYHYSPNSLFKTHLIYPIPNSVTELSWNGEIGLFQSSWTLNFKINKEDFQKILSIGGYQQVHNNHDRDSLEEEYKKLINNKEYNLYFDSKSENAYLDYFSP